MVAHSNHRATHYLLRKKSLLLAKEVDLAAEEPVPRADQAASELARIKRLAEEHGNALRRAYQLLYDGALVGPAAGELFVCLTSAHRSARSGFYEAFDQVQHLAAQAEGGPPRLGEPYVPGPPRGGLRASNDIRSGSPELLNLLVVELDRVGREWGTAGDVLARTLGELGLATAPAQAISGAGRRVGAQQSDVRRRRDALVKADQQAAVQAATNVVRATAQAIGSAQSERPGLLKSAWNASWDIYVKRYLGGVAEGVKEIGLTALASNAATSPFYAVIDREGWTQRGATGQVQGLLYGVQHPVAFGKAIINWDEWKKDPVRAYGHMVPGAILTVTTGGAGTAGNASSKVALVAGRFGKVKPVHPRGRTRGVRGSGDPPEPAARGPAHASHGDGGPPRVPAFTARELAELRAAERAAQELADRYGVRIDYSTHPISPSVALRINTAIARMAREYPSVFRRLGNVRVQSLEEMSRTKPNAGSTLGYCINQGERLRGDWVTPPSGIYLNQSYFAVQKWIDDFADASHRNNWHVERGATPEGTFYHEFGHRMGREILSDPELRLELARDLRAIGLKFDPDGLSPDVVRGWRPVQEGLSRYGASKPAEMLAEAFAEWKLSANPRPIATVIGRFIDRHYAGK